VVSRTLTSWRSWSSVRDRVGRGAVEGGYRIVFQSTLPAAATPLYSMKQEA